MTASRQIKDFLEARGISQAHISRETGIPLPKLSLALNEKRRLKLEEYEEICGALGVGCDTFLTPRSPENRVV